MSEEERRRLGLGEHPIADVFKLLESSGMRILRTPLPPELNVAGVFLFKNQNQAAFSLIDNNYSLDQQALIAAHLYCHYLKDREDEPVIDNPDVFVPDYVSLYPAREVFAHSFASHFLIPQSRFNKIIRSDLRVSRLNFGDVTYLKRYFRVPTALVLQRLYEGEYITQGEMNRLKKKDSFLWEELLFSSGTHPVRKKKKSTQLSDRFTCLCFAALSRKKISLEEVSRMLGLNSGKLQQLMD